MNQTCQTDVGQDGMVIRLDQPTWIGILYTSSCKGCRCYLPKCLNWNHSRELDHVLVSSGIISSTSPHPGQIKVFIASIQVNESMVKKAWVPVWFTNVGKNWCTFQVVKQMGWGPCGFLDDPKPASVSYHYGYQSLWGLKEMKSKQIYSYKMDKPK